MQHRFLFVLFLASAAPMSGCGITWNTYAKGTASYTGASSVDAIAGALPLRAAMCAGTTSSTSLMRVRLGDRCVLEGPWASTGGTNGSARLTPLGECALPFGEGVVSPVRVEQATLAVSSGVLDVSVGGATPGGHYVSYRFTGALESHPSANACVDLGSAAPLARRDLPSPLAPKPDDWMATPKGSMPERWP